MNEPGKPVFSKEEAFQKVKHYCAWQERCHQEVKEKLYGLGLHKTDTEELLSQLIQENYLNEERFSIQYAGGKFRMKQWGRVKIRHALKQKRVSEYCIRKALLQIEEEAYLETLKTLAEEKWKSLKREKSIFSKKRKTQDFLLQKGYEAALITEAIHALQGTPQ